MHIFARLRRCLEQAPDSNEVRDALDLIDLWCSIQKRREQEKIQKKDLTGEEKSDSLTNGNAVQEVKA